MDNIIIDDTKRSYQVYFGKITHNNCMRDIVEINNIFIERLKDLMQDKGLTPTTLSKCNNIPRTTISGWLNGKRSPKIDGIDAVADYFKVTTDYLLGREN